MSSVVCRDCMAEKLDPSDLSEANKGSAMRYCQDKDINRLVAEMVRSGWHFDRGRHGKLYHPACQGFITIPKTPSDRRSLLNIKRDIRRVEGRALT